MAEGAVFSLVSSTYMQRFRDLLSLATHNTAASECGERIDQAIDISGVTRRLNGTYMITYAVTTTSENSLDELSPRRAYLGDSGPEVQSTSRHSLF